eukprot:ANDGO_01782.mRNA.1 Formin-F
MGIFSKKKKDDKESVSTPEKDGSGNSVHGSSAHGSGGSAGSGPGSGPGSGSGSSSGSGSGSGPGSGSGGSDEPMPAIEQVDEMYLELMVQLSINSKAREAMMLKSPEEKWKLIKMHLQREKKVPAPEFSVHELRSNPSGKILETLTVLLRTQSVTWLMGFIECGGLDILFSLIPDLVGKTSENLRSRTSDLMHSATGGQTGSFRLPTGVAEGASAAQSHQGNHTQSSASASGTASGPAAGSAGSGSSPAQSGMAGSSNAAAAVPTPLQQLGKDLENVLHCIRNVMNTNAGLQAVTMIPDVVMNLVLVFESREFGAKRVMLELLCAFLNVMQDGYWTVLAALSHFRLLKRLPSRFTLLISPFRVSSSGHAAPEEYLVMCLAFFNLLVDHAPDDGSRFELVRELLQTDLPSLLSSYCENVELTERIVTQIEYFQLYTGLNLLHEFEMSNALMSHEGDPDYLSHGSVLAAALGSGAVSADDAVDEQELFNRLRTRTAGTDSASYLRTLLRTLVNFDSSSADDWLRIDLYASQIVKPKEHHQRQVSDADRLVEVDQHLTRTQQKLSDAESLCKTLEVSKKRFEEELEKSRRDAEIAAEKVRLLQEQRFQRC